MARKFIFTDEAGDFAFKRGPNVPGYFIVCSVTLDTCEVGETRSRYGGNLLGKGHLSATTSTPQRTGKS
jgi:hypothetical protein